MSTDSIEEALRDGGQPIFATPPQPAPLDDEGCVSTLELSLLAHAMGMADRPADLTPPSGARRAGYLLSERDGVAWPLLAFALAEGWDTDQLNAHFADLWQVDHAVWQAIQDDEPPRSIARRWLLSPGRRLLCDLSAARLDRDRGAARFDVGSIHAAAGISASAPVGLLRRHAEAPGPALDAWRPDADNVGEAFRALHGTSDLRRAGALLWLMRRMASAPVYRTKQLSADLRQTLPQQIEAALTLAPSSGTRLDAAALLHVWGLEHRWPLARWLVSCLSASPFFGQDAEVLAARLRALPHASAPHLAQLQPLREAALLSAIMPIASSYETFGPLPLPCTEWLQRVASAPEIADTPWIEELPWPAAWRPTAPACVARRILNEQGVGWLAELPEAAFDALLQAPTSPQWFADAVFAEGAHLVPERRDALLERWRSQFAEPARIRLPMGVGLIDSLTDAEVDGLLIDLPTLVDEEARLGLLRAIGKRRQSYRDQIVDALLEQANAGSDWLRLNAVFSLVRLLGEVPRADRGHWQEALDALMGHPVIVNNVPLRREARRLGFLGG